MDFSSVCQDPACRDMGCPALHPPCVFGIQCFGRLCDRIHPPGRLPPCHFAAACHNLMCPDGHPPSRCPPCPNLACRSESCRMQHPPCVYGVGCYGQACFRAHPPDRKTPCRYSSECQDDDCPYGHPPRPIRCRIASCRDMDCRYLHGPCEYGIRCYGRACSRQHPAGRPEPCWYSDACYDATCQKGHPPTWEKCAAGRDCDDPFCVRAHPPCLYGVECFGRMCNRMHPPGRLRPCLESDACADPACRRGHPPWRRDPWLDMIPGQLNVRTNCSLGPHCLGGNCLCCHHNPRLKSLFASQALRWSNRAEAMVVLAHTILREGCTLYGGFVRDWVVRGEEANDIDTLVDRDSFSSLEAAIRATAKQFSMQVSASKAKGLACTFEVTGGWGKKRIEIDFVVPSKSMPPPHGTCPKPGVDCSAGNLCVSPNGTVVQKVPDARGVSLRDCLEHCRNRKFVFFYSYVDQAASGCYTKRITKYLERKWTMVCAPEAALVKNGGCLAGFVGQIAPEARYSVPRFWE